MKDYQASEDKIAGLEKSLEEREDAIEDLEIKYEGACKSAAALNRMVNDNRVKYEEEKLTISKNHKNEVKLWKKDLGNANKRHIKLEKKFMVLSNNNMEAEYRNKTLCLSDEFKTSNDMTTNEIMPLCVDIPSSTSKELCSLCAEEIMHYVPDYFLGEKINAACLKCKNNEEESNPLSSFPLDGLPSSLVSHWILPHYEPFTSLSYNSTFRSHYVRLPNPGDYFVSTQDMLRELQELLQKHFDEQRQLAKKTCKQS